MAKLRKRYCYDYPRPAVTVDVVCLRTVGRQRQVLLVRRGQEPFRGTWALPGGFMNIDEDLAAAARRELKEETGLAVRTVEQVRAFGRPDRDPRGRTISIAFRARVGRTEAAAEVRGADDAAEARWFDLGNLPPLAFDHHEIIESSVRRIPPRNTSSSSVPPLASLRGAERRSNPVMTPLGKGARLPRPANPKSGPRNDAKYLDAKRGIPPEAGRNGAGSIRKVRKLESNRSK